MNKKPNNFYLCIDPPCFILNKIDKIKCNKKKCKIHAYFEMIYTENDQQYEELIYGKILTQSLISTISRNIMFDNIKKDNIIIIQK